MAALNLEQSDTKILYLPLKDEILPNLTPHTTLKQSEHTDIAQLRTDSFDVVTGITKLAYSPSLLTSIARVLKPGGIVMIQIGKESPLKRSLLYAGFVDIEHATQSEVNHWTARKPSTAMKAAPLKLNLSAKKKLKVSEEKSQSKSNVWSLGMDDMTEADIELVDEDTLLDHEEEAVEVAKAEDCGVGSSRKPCKDCSCGRKEEFDAEQNGGQPMQKREMPKIYDPNTSACGNCHLGDAFRCGGCPYLGKPAFDPNSQTVKLQLD